MKIRITSVPAGSAPLNIREQWVGVEIRLLPQFNEFIQKLEASGHRGLDVATLKRVATDDPNVGGYGILMSDAIQALRDAGMVEAADWWDKYAKQTGMDTLIFGKQFCELLPD